MPLRKELCRNFQQGSCHFGDRCKFLHGTQQQSFGANQQQPFGANHQQQKSNPYGFGVQNSSQSKGFKPFENKWTRFSPISNGSAPSSQQQRDNQPQAVNHNCTDFESCKRLFVEDFQNERPLWRLTCYGHLKNAPCDISGDISYEELRAAAYDDAKRGLGLQSIVERERNLLNSKLNEFDNLLRAPPKSALSSQGPLRGAPPNATSAVGQNNAPLSVSSFAQLGASLNIRPSAPSNNNAFGQPNLFSTSSQTSSPFRIDKFPSANAGSPGSQVPNQAFGSSFSSNIPAFGNNVVISAQSNSFSSSALSTQIHHSSSVQPSVTPNWPNSASNASELATTNVQSVC